MVSLQQQRLTVFSAGTPVASSSVSTGQSGFDTPAGIYSILQKNRYHESNIYSGAPMPYMQRITWSGIALHEGQLPGYPASHGCIRLPGAFASSLFGMTNVGARVIVSQSPLTPRAFEHDKLFKPLPSAAPVTVAQLGNWGAAQQAASAGHGYVINAAAGVPAALERPAAAASAANGHVSILISRQTGKIYIRRNFEPVYEGPIAIQDPDLPLGTHLFTAVGQSNDRSRLVWNVVTFPPDAPKAAGKALRNKLSDIERADAAAGVRRAWVTPPGAALERIAFEPDLLEEIAEVARPGMSLLITDRGLGSETGKGTEFVVQTR
jgi:L,D-transpeptidase catalytic domain